MKISIIIPCYNNEQSLFPLVERLQNIEKNEIFKNVDFEYIFIDDGSIDRTYENQCTIKNNYSTKTKLIKLTRNFGSYNSFLAGMHYASGDCNVYLHADLQDPPELIPELYENYLKGYQLVIANRIDREDKSLLSLFYHYFVKKFAIKDIPPGGFDLILFSKNIKQKIIEISEKNTNNVYLITWLGFPYVNISYKREKRKFGNSQWSFWGKVKLFIDTIYSFTDIPLWLVRALFFCSLITFIFVLVGKLFQFNFINGYIILISLLFLILITCSMILLEYLVRIHETVRNRPNFVVEKIIE